MIEIILGRIQRWVRIDIENTTGTEDVPDARGMLLVQAIGTAFEISFTVLHSWTAVRCDHVHGLFP